MVSFGPTDGEPSQREELNRRSGIGSTQGVEMLWGVLRLGKERTENAIFSMRNCACARQAGHDTAGLIGTIRGIAARRQIDGCVPVIAFGRVYVAALTNDPT